MPLTSRLDGRAAQNLINSDWFNDYYKLLTGTMADQPVTINNNLQLTALGGTPAPPATMTGAPTSGGSMTLGAYKYWVVYLCGTNNNGISLPSSPLLVSTTSGNLSITLGSIPTGPTGTTARGIFRTSVGGVTPKYLVTITDNTTMTYLDTLADSGLPTSSTAFPLHSSFGGSVVVTDSLGTVNAVLNNDGCAQVSAVDLSTTTPYITSSAGYIGFKNHSGTKLAEITGAGNLIIGGTFVGTTSGTNPALQNSKTFDGFDVAEIYKTDHEYDNGTVVCPGEGGLMRQCVHDNCYAASVISHNPGLMLGQESETEQLVALTGRVMCKTSANIGYRVLVCSDGAGGVRPLYPDQPSYTIGYTLSASQDGMVGVMLRPMYCFKE